MRSVIIMLALWMAAMPATARPPAPTPPEQCYYAGAMSVISYRPRIVAPRFYKVDPFSLSIMRKATRVSVMHPRYDVAWEKTDVATRFIRHAVVIAFPCKMFRSKKNARGFIKERLLRWWRIMTSMQPYQGTACCWQPTRVRKILSRPRRR